MSHTWLTLARYKDDTHAHGRFLLFACSGRCHFLTHSLQDSTTTVISLRPARPFLAASAYLSNHPPRHRTSQTRSMSTTSLRSLSNHSHQSRVRTSRRQTMPTTRCRMKSQTSTGPNHQHTRVTAEMCIIPIMFHRRLEHTT